MNNQHTPNSMASILQLVLDRRIRSGPCEPEHLSPRSSQPKLQVSRLAESELPVQLRRPPDPTIGVLCVFADSTQHRHPHPRLRTPGSRPRGRTGDPAARSGVHATTGLRSLTTPTPATCALLEPSHRIKVCPRRAPNKRLWWRRFERLLLVALAQSREARRSVGGQMACLALLLRAL